MIFYLYKLYGYIPQIIAIYIFVLVFLLPIVKRSSLNIYDPLYYYFFIFLIPAFVGFFSFGLLFDTMSFWVISSFIAVLFIIITCFRPGTVNLEDNLPKHFQIILLFLCLIVLLANFYINVYLPGKIPILMKDSVDIRFSASQNSRVLYWLSLSINSIPAIIFAISRYRYVRRFSLFVFFIYFLLSLLMASKGAILSCVFLEVLVLFISKSRKDYVRFRFHKKILLILICLTIGAIPFYLYTIGVASGASSGVEKIILFKLFYRFFYAFDQLIPAFKLNLIKEHYLPISQIGLNIVQYQFLSIYKLISGFSPKFDSIGAFIIYKLYGSLYGNAHAYPNSNLIMECLLTSGVVLGGIFYFLELSIIFYIRKYTISKTVNIIRLFLFIVSVYSPYGIFLSGLEFINRMIFLIMFISFCWCIYYFLLMVSKRQRAI
ncbi:MAG: hypothetical protein CENE_00513 [Candidatus Celerinatantimonas neptuna]|nr:MAG: hypothetical protein CENE_00513 [Candidatus Celerinatantimonas neptuna]